MPYLGRAPTVANNVTGDLAVSGAILADGQISGDRINHKLALNGSDASSPQANENDQFLIEDGGTDGSGTNAGDNLLLENATPSQAKGEYTAAQSFILTTLTDAANIQWDLATNQVAQVVLGGSRVLDAPSGQVAGSTYILIVKQDGSGSRTLNTDASAYKFPGGTSPTLSTGANAVDVLTFVSDGTSMYGVSQLNFS